MCGGIAFNFDDIAEDELMKFFLPEELSAFRAMGYAESFFWARRPVLPAIIASAEAAVHLYDWGNREKDVELPKTGWARTESLDAGRWNYLHPMPIIIPCERGYEKKVWFEIMGGIEGVLVEKDDITRAYMLTVPSSKEYAAKTGHDRMPKVAEGKIRF